MITRNQIYTAIVSGWCQPETERTQADPILAKVITEQVMKVINIDSENTEKLSKAADLGLTTMKTIDKITNLYVNQMNKLLKDIQVNTDDGTDTVNGKEGGVSDDTPSEPV